MHLEQIKADLASEREQMESLNKTMDLGYILRQQSDLSDISDKTPIKSEMSSPTRRRRMTISTKPDP